MTPPWAASANILTSGFVRSLISFPEEFNKTLGYSARNCFKEKGPDTRHSSRSLLVTFVNPPRYLRQFCNYLENFFHRRIHAVLFSPLKTSGQFPRLVS